MAHVPGHGVVFLNYDDATEHYQDGGLKDATYVYEGIRNAIEEVGPNNVMLVVTDCAAVMKSAWKLLQNEYPSLFCIGCLPHQVNTFIKHICKRSGASTAIFEDVDNEEEYPGQNMIDDGYDMNDGGTDCFVPVRKLIAKCKVLIKTFNNIHANKAKLRQASL